MSTDRPTSKKREYMRSMARVAMSVRQQRYNFKESTTISLDLSNPEDNRRLENLMLAGKDDLRLRTLFDLDYRSPEAKEANP